MASAESVNSYPNNRQENWIRYRESETFKEGVKKLEEFEALAPHDKIIILAVALNLKKAGVIDLYPTYGSPGTLEEIFSSLGTYFYRSAEMEEWTREWERSHGVIEEVSIACYAIGASPDALAEAMKVTSRAKPQEDYVRAFGRTMEYPLSAVEAFGASTATRDDDHLLDFDDSRLTQEEKAFSFFRLSKAHWEEEIQWLEQIIAGVKQYSPKIYEQVMAAAAARDAREMESEEDVA